MAVHRIDYIPVKEEMEAKQKSKIYSRFFSDKHYIFFKK